MWTVGSRSRYDRTRLRYPSAVTDAEWALIAPLIPPAKRGGRKRSVDLREVTNGIMYILSTGCQWGYIPKDLPPKTTIFNYLDLWEYAGVIDASITLYMSSATRWRGARQVPPPV